MLENVRGPNNLGNRRKEYGIELELLIFEAKICGMVMVAILTDA